jgi:hypothetical protein
MLTDMLGIASSSDFVAEILRAKPLCVTLDLETLDSGALRLWNQPIVSFSVSGVGPGIHDWTFPTFGAIVESTDEEQQLLELIRQVILRLKQFPLAGHNICLRYANIDNGWEHGYDLPKIQGRGGLHGVDFSFLQNLKVFDTMDVAYAHYDHEERARLTRMPIKRILSSLDIERDLNIIRPTEVPKLGPQVRDFFKTYEQSSDKIVLQKILRYNCSDTLAESIIAKVFFHRLKCRHGVVGPKTSCNHLPIKFHLDENPSWRTLLARKPVPILPHLHPRMNI